MRDTLNYVPRSVPTDSGEVCDALEVAAAAWEAGDSIAAIRWVRRAAEAADAEGDVVRMASLARAAAELEELRPADSETRAKVSPPSASSPPSISSPRVSMPPPSSPSPHSSAPPPPRSTTRPPAPISKAPPLPKPPVPKTTRPSVARSLPSSPPVPSGAVPGRELVRVSVRTSLRDPTLLVVRPLAIGHAPPPGAREGFLVLTDESVEPVSLGRSEVR
jgi:hypothetical protein